MAFFASVAAKPPHHLGHMRPVAHRQDIAVIVVGISKAVLRPGIGILHRGKLRGGVVRTPGVHRPVAVVRGQDVVRNRSAQASVAVVGEVPPGGSTHVQRRHVPVIPVGVGKALPVHRLRQGRDLVVAVIRPRVLVNHSPAAVLLHHANQPVGAVVVVPQSPRLCLALVPLHPAQSALAVVVVPPCVCPVASARYLVGVVVGVAPALAVPVALARERPCPRVVAVRHQLPTSHRHAPRQSAGGVGEVIGRVCPTAVRDGAQPVLRVGVTHPRAPALTPRHPLQRIVGAASS